MAFLAGCGGLADVIKFQIVPAIPPSINQNLINVMQYIAGFLDSLAYYCAPYCLLIFSIFNSELLNSKKRYYTYVANIGLFIPIIFMYSISSFYPFFQISYKALLVWATPYFLISDFLLVYAVLIAKDRNTKKQRILSCLLLTPLATALFLTNYVGMFLGITVASLWFINDIIGFLTLFGFIFIAFKHGILGVKIEVFDIDNQMKIATWGTSLINHTIKNEIAKIKICIKNISPYIATNQITKDSMEIINEAYNHIFDFVSRIQEKMQTTVLKEELCNLSSMIDTTLNAIKPLLQNRNIKIITKVEPEITLLCDPVHLKEVLLNILKNAVEAVPASKNGCIEVVNKWRKKQMILEIRDNGTGVSKEVLPHVFKPFFSTKHTSVNFGLGLSYSLNVLQKSGGTIEIQSETNIGTTVLLKFPIAKFVRNHTITKSRIGGSHYGEREHNQDIFGG